MKAIQCTYSVSCLFIRGSCIHKTVEALGPIRPSVWGDYHPESNKMFDVHIFIFISLQIHWDQTVPLKHVSDHEIYNSISEVLYLLYTYVESVGHTNDINWPREFEIVAQCAPYTHALAVYSMHTCMQHTYMHTCMHAAHLTWQHSAYTYTSGNSNIFLRAVLHCSKASEWCV